MWGGAVVKRTKVQEGAEAVGRFAADYAALRDAIGRVIVGHEEAIRDVLLGFFAGGHILVEGVPGTGKTLLVRTLAQAVSLLGARSVADLVGQESELGVTPRRPWVPAPAPSPLPVQYATGYGRFAPAPRRRARE